MKNRHITAIVLAAGKSTRYGHDKRLIKINGESMLHTVIRKVSVLSTDLLVVLGKHDGDLAADLPVPDDSILFCHNADLGMGYSLACAVRAKPTSQAWMVCLADMPYIQEQTCRSVIHAMQSGADLCAPYFDNKRGHPVAFSLQYRDELSALTGDKGAKDILERHKDKLTKLHVNDAGILIDIDSPQDLQKPPLTKV